MDASKTLLASLAVMAVAVLSPSAALAGAVVPPGNSAANQYTETFPTTGGNTEAKKGKHKVTPAEAIGSGPAKKLDSRGKQGRETAAVVAATAPPPLNEGGESSEGGDEGSGSAAAGAAGTGDGGSGHGTGSQSGSQGRAAGGNGSGGGASHSVNVVDSALAEPGGSSGFAEVVGQATGSTSSGGTGLLLPLAVLATAIWAVVFLLRRKRRTA